VLQYGAADDLEAIEFSDLAIFSDTSQLLRAMAALEASGADAAHELSQPRSSQRPERQPLGEFKQSFLVANPNAKREQVKLTVRRLALPPDWRVALVADPPPDDASTEHAHDAPAAANAKAPSMKTEDQGRAYSIELEPGQQVRLTSILLPIGPAGEETRPRWAVEGSIGSTVIGGVVHEMHVPAAAETIQLPPAGAEDTTALSPDPSTAAVTRAVAAPAVDLAHGSRKWLWIVLVLLALLAITAAWWTKRRRPT
jgi:hypothetical protein